MVFQLETTDGLSQKGTYPGITDTISLPNIIFPKITDFPIPQDASLVLQDHSKKDSKNEYHITTHHPDQPLNNRTIFTITNPVFFPHIISNLTEELINTSYPPNDQNTYVLTGIPKKTDIPSYSNISLFIISHALQLYKNPADIVTYLHHLRTLISPEQLIYLPSIATPQNIPILLSLGADLVDTMQAIIAARSHTLLFPEGPIQKTKMNINPCHCPHCLSKKTNPKELTFTEILKHNYEMMQEEIEKSKRAISTETLRELVGIRISNSPHLTTIIRHAEHDPYRILEQRTPRHKKSLIKATQIDALQRPEIKRFQQDIIERYRKPKRTNILVILPCSAKKPYSFSKSHKKLISTIQSVPNHHQIHELIITSPLGIVPRELELMYPASSYDIPVSGNWYEDEKKMILNLLHEYLSHNHYEKIIIHIPDPLNSLIQNAYPKAISTHCTTSATNKKALEQLAKTLKESIEHSEKITRKQRMKDNMMSLVSFQFSSDIAQQLLQDVTIKGKYPFVKLFDSSQTQLGMLTDSRGMISLTIQGAQRLHPCKRFYVNTSSDFTLKGSLFSPGVVDADPLIRKGDEVFVYQQNTLTGVGVAQLNGVDMVKRMSGKAVDIRHIIH